MFLMMDFDVEDSNECLIEFCQKCILKDIVPPVIRQKGESENGGNKKNKADQIFRKTNISYPLIRTHFCIIKDQLGL